MKTYLINLLDDLRSSYWFYPAILIILTLFLGQLTPKFDDFIWDKYPVPEWLKSSEEAARSSLAAISGAMVSVTGTVFSITIVTLSLTSQQFGPRLIRTFMQDTLTQITLGVFLSTATYSLTLLSSINTSSENYSLPHFSIFLALVFCIISIGFLIAFIHHIAILIQAPRIVWAVAVDLDQTLERLYPENIGNTKEDLSDKNLHSFQVENELPNESLSIASEQEGYIQAIDSETLIEYAKKNEATIKLLVKPGDFIAPEKEIASVWGKGFENDKMQDKINTSIITGIRRTTRQDIGCGVSELVEVAVRSLSPGINDPFTAANCVDRLGSFVYKFALKDIPSALRYDEKGNLVLIAEPLSFEELMDSAFSQIHLYSQSSILVKRKLLDAYSHIVKACDSSQKKNALKKYVNFLYQQKDVEAESLIDERIEQLKTKIG